MEENIRWNAESWKQRFQHAAKTRNHYELHALRIEVYRNTLDIVRNGQYETSQGERVSLDNTDALISGSRFYDQELLMSINDSERYLTHVEVVNNDCLAVAQALSIGADAVCVLNLANRRNPGGGVISGCGAQEEYLFRCSDYYRSLYQFAHYAEQYGLPLSEKYRYPMDRNFGGVFSPGVTIFRGCEEKGYPLLAQPWKVNMIAVAGMNRPELEYTNDESRVASYLVPGVKNKMRTIFRIARENNQKTLVLGALGCGAFRNPPRHTAEMFREVMEEPEFSGAFKHICFAIKEDHNSRGAGNYAPFAEVFQNFNLCK